MKIAVLGARGVIGRNLIPRLIEARHQVRAGVRKIGSAPKFEHLQEMEADILNVRSMAAFVQGIDVLVNLASSIPRADGKSGDWDTYDRIRRDGTRNLLRVCEEAGVGLLAQSVAMLHSVDQSRPQDERDLMAGRGVLASGLDQERMLAEWSGEWRIVRGGLLYGPGTSTDDAWFQQYVKGELRAPGDGEDWSCRVHIADLAAAFQTVLEKAPPRTAWIAADDEPLRWGEVYEVVANLCRNSRGKPGTGAEKYLPSFRVSNAALRRLGWMPRYASVRSGLVGAAERVDPSA